MGRLSFFLIALLFCAEAMAAATVKDIRLGEHPDKTRLVIDLSGSVDFSYFTLARPERVVIDLPELDFKVPDASIHKKSNLIGGMRFGLFKPGNARIVLDLAQPAKVTKAFHLPPSGSQGHRLVFDLGPTDMKSFVAALKPPSPAAKPQPAEEPPVSYGQRPRRKDGKRVVVLDPGHGGVDPGAIGISGSYEKHITLGFARQLRKELEKTGKYHVVLTRDRDIFLKLRSRVAKARQLNGELFISIHADSIGVRNMRGTGVYTLSEKSSDKEAAALAAKENKADVIAGMDLESHDDEVASILIDLTQRETMNYSVQFADAMVKRFREAGRMRRKPHRFAGFRVLKAPDVPSVLLELGYLSNPGEEKLLRSTKARAPLVKAVARAIGDYFASLDS